MLTAEDRILIQDLVHRYANAMDFEDGKAWLETWADDGAWEGPVGTFKGKSELPKLLEILGPRAKGKRHIITNSCAESTEEPDVAKQICYMTIIDATSDGRIIGTAVYTDTLQKTGNEWKFKIRRLKFDSNFRPQS